MAGFTLMPWAPSQWTDSLGNILEFGIIRFYEAGTLIPKTTYKKADGSEANTNPLILDSAARARVWLTNDEAYDIIVHNKNDELEYSILDVLASSGGSGGGTSVDRKVAADDIDMVPGVLVDKMRSSSSVTITVVDVGGRKLQFSVDETWLGNWLTFNYPFPADDHLVISDGTMQTAGTLAQKVTDALGTVFAVNGDKQLVIPLQSYLSLVGGGTVTGPTTFTNVTIPDQFKIKSDSGDIAGYYVDKIQPGAGVAFNITVDDVNGSVLHISSVDENPITAPLDEVISGDGAGGIKSSPLFKASAGAVSAETFRANSTDVAIAAPNGSILVQNIASIDTSNWGGEGIAFFGLKDHNPPTNDGTIVGTMLGTYSMASYVRQGGSITLGVGAASQFGLYDSLATFLVPVFANAFNPTDVSVLVGSTYASTFHAVIAFFGTGTTFAVPSGSSLNTGMRLSNSSAVGVSITGVATPFTLAPGTSRDLIWTADSITPTVDKWY